MVILALLRAHFFGLIVLFVGDFLSDTLHCCRSGADFLGPLLPAVAEICSDFDPTIDVEPSLLKLFRNLWFYIALFGLAPPIQKTQPPVKSVSSTLNSVGSMGTIPLQAVTGPYMWNTQWSSAVQHIAQGTPPLVSRSINALLYVLCFYYSFQYVCGKLEYVGSLTSVCIKYSVRVAW